MSGVTPSSGTPFGDFIDDLIKERARLLRIMDETYEGIDPGELVTMPYARGFYIGTSVGVRAIDDLLEQVGIRFNEDGEACITGGKRDG